MPLSHPSRRRADFAIDLGTANTIVVERGSGIVFNEPSVCCFKAYHAVPQFVSAGSEAHSLVGRTARPFKIVRPLRNGVLSDMKAAAELIRFATRSAGRAWTLRRARALVGVPADATEAERKALTSAVVDAGLAEPELVSEPLMSGIGAGLAVQEPRGRMVVDCGAGTTEVAVISLGTIVFSRSVRGGGEALDQSLIDHLHLTHRFKAGPATAERLKLNLSELLCNGDSGTFLAVRGIDEANGLPKTINVPASELLGMWNRYSDSVLAAVQAALRETAPELSHDILEDGIILTGGASMTGLLASRIQEATGIQTRIDASPLHAVAAGLWKVLEQRV